MTMNVAAAPRRPIGASPVRPPGSIRRTASIDTSWPEGRYGPMHLQGHARDLLTPPSGAPSVCAQDWIDVLATPRREILQISATPARDAVAKLIGERAGGHLRAVIDQHLPAERDAGSPLYLLLDDLSGASLVAGWAWSRWVEDWLVKAREEGRSSAGRNGRMEGVCIGFAPGSSALLGDGSSSAIQSSAPVPPLEHPDDPHGWHPLPHQEGVGMRRARRIDVWLDRDLIRIDGGFQDSSTAPGGGRVAVHEYAFSATADRQTHRLMSVQADPRVLPYGECPGAIGNVARLVGEPLGTLRKAVLVALRGTAGCTHLNDAMRSLAEVPRLAEILEDA